MKLVVFIVIILLGVASSICYAESFSLSADAAVMIDAKTGRILYEKNAFIKKPMASTTKIMTAILAIDNGNLKDVVTASQRACNINGTSVDLYVGEKQTLEDLLYGLMLVSGNDAAIAIAEHIGKTEEQFAKMMTEKAHKIGAKNTQFKNAHGLDAPGHYTTAYDLALIGRYAMQNPTFRTIVGTKRRVIPDLRHKEWDRGLQNKNRLLYEYPGAIGIKTGFTGDAGQCFVGAAQREGREVITVVLHATMSRQSKWIDTKKLLNHAFKEYNNILILSQKEFHPIIQVGNGEVPQIEGVLDKDVNLLLKSNEEKQIQLQVQVPENLKAPVKKGQKIGAVKVYLNNNLIYTETVASAVDVNAKKFIIIQENYWGELKKLFKRWLNLMKEV